MCDICTLKAMLKDSPKIIRKCEMMHHITLNRCATNSFRLAANKLKVNIVDVDATSGARRDEAGQGRAGQGQPQNAIEEVQHEHDESKMRRI